MSDVGQFTVRLEQREGYQFNVQFDWARAPDLLMDEPPPLGETEGPNASRLLAAAVGNCLSASLLYCLGKEDVPDASLETEVTCTVVRNERKRMRIGSLDVRIRMDGGLSGSPRLGRCKALYEDFCTVSSSIREGIPMRITLEDADGTVIAGPEDTGQQRRS